MKRVFGELCEILAAAMLVPAAVGLALWAWAATLLDPELRREAREWDGPADV